VPARLTVWSDRSTSPLRDWLAFLFPFFFFYASFFVILQAAADGCQLRSWFGCNGCRYWCRFSLLWAWAVVALAAALWMPSAVSPMLRVVYDCGAAALIEGLGLFAVVVCVP
jgi:hypothetical protein